MKTIQEWESEFHEKLQAIPTAKREKAGILFSIIPNRDDGAAFSDCVRHQWQNWEHCLSCYPTPLTG